jgi:hypothetical protein
METATNIIKPQSTNVLMRHPPKQLIVCLGQSHWYKDKDSKPGLLGVECWRLSLRQWWHKAKVVEAARSAPHSHAAGRPAPRFRSPDLQEVPITSARLTGSPKPSSASQLRHRFAPGKENSAEMGPARCPHRRLARALCPECAGVGSSLHSTAAPPAFTKSVVSLVERGIGAGGGT